MRRAQTFVVAVIAPLTLAACATIGPPKPPSLELPKPPTDLRAVRKGKRVTLTWTTPTFTTDRETIRSLGPTRICRAEGELKDCSTPIDETKATVTTRTASQKPPQASYIDTLPPQLLSDTPSAFATYAVQVSNRDGRAAGLSNHVRVPLAHTLSPPRDFRVQVAKGGPVLTWTADAISRATDDVQYLYRAYRRAEGSDQPAIAGETPAGANTAYSLTDPNMEWEKTYYYHVEAVTQIHQANNSRLEVEGDDSPEVEIFADDVFPPAVPSDLQAVFSGPGQKPFIDLVWAPVADVDLAGYNIYRHEEGPSPTKLNAELIKTPAYRDENVASQKKYFYSVSAVDVRGNESARSEEANETVP